MNKYKNFREIPVWKTSHEVAVKIYKLTKQFPKEEVYGITSQLRRSASSVPANIVEGFYRNTTKELIKFLYNSRGSAGETLQHLILSKDLDYMKESEFKETYDSYENILKQLSGWIRVLKSRV